MLEAGKMVEYMMVCDKKWCEAVELASSLKQDNVHTLALVYRGLPCVEETVEFYIKHAKDNYGPVPGYPTGA